jgi:hypothetical protein
VEQLILGFLHGRGPVLREHEVLIPHCFR